MVDWLEDESGPQHLFRGGICYLLSVKRTIGSVPLVSLLKRFDCRLFPSSPLGPLYQNEVGCSAFDMKMIFHSRANKTRFHKKGFALRLILEVRVFGTRKWPISTNLGYLSSHV